MTPPVLEQGPFTLRLPRAEDVSWIFHACQDPEIQRYTMVPVPYRPADAVTWVTDAAYPVRDRRRSRPDRGEDRDRRAGRGRHPPAGGR